jgi:hypothetical protein
MLSTRSSSFAQRGSTPSLQRQTKFPSALMTWSRWFCTPALAALSACAAPVAVVDGALEEDPEPVILIGIRHHSGLISILAVLRTDGSALWSTNPTHGGPPYLSTTSGITRCEVDDLAEDIVTSMEDIGLLSSEVHECHPWDATFICVQSRDRRVYFSSSHETAEATGVWFGSDKSFTACWPFERDRIRDRWSAEYRRFRTAWSIARDKTSALLSRIPVVRQTRRASWEDEVRSRMTQRSFEQQWLDSFRRTTREDGK